MLLSAVIGLCFALALFGEVSALTCYQGQLDMKATSNATAVQCPVQAYSCIISIDYSQGVVTKACQSTNCTILGTYQTSNTSACYNSTGYPPQTFCCCYGDGCNKYPDLMATVNTYVIAPKPAADVPCSSTGIWGNWSSWDPCPADTDPIFQALSSLNMQTRYRQCLAQPTGCTKKGSFMCTGPYWEGRPCQNGTTTSV